MSKWIERGGLALILLVAAALRFTGIDWDAYQHYHPDERHITWVATSIEWPTTWSAAFNPTQSSFNPYYWPPDAASRGIEVLQDEPRSFAYGHFPLYLGVTITRLVERLGPSLASRLPADWLLTQDILNQSQVIEFRHLTAVTRALTGLIDVGTVWLLFLLGRRLYGTAVGLLAAAFLALNVMHVQLAHFFAFDPYMTFFVVAALYAMVLSLETASHGRYLLLASIFTGLAIGSKFAAILLVLPLAVTIWLGWKRWRQWWPLAAVLVVGITFFLTNPFAILDLTCEAVTPRFEIGSLTIPALDWHSCFLQNVGTQGAMVRGQLDLAFTRQYAGTTPYLYYIEMQLRWGMGLLLGLVAFAGFGWAVWRTVPPLWRWLRQERHIRPAWSHNPSSSGPPLSQLVLLTWAVPYFLSTGSFYVKFMRYMQPLTPFLMLFGAAMLLSWRRVAWRRSVVTLVLATTGLYALSFVQLYDRPHPWVAASQWIHLNVAPGALILGEQWDEPLPSSLRVDGEFRRRTAYRNKSLNWLSETGANDDEDKLQRNLSLLAEADYVVVASNRVYGVVPRSPGRYPISSQYHQLLFDGSLGYEPVFVNGRSPHLADFHLWPDRFGWPDLQPPVALVDYLNDKLPGLNGGRADESFTVYDQPLTMIFENRGRLTAEEMKQSFELNES